MRTFFESPAILSAVIAASAVVVSAIISIKSQHALKRGDVMSQGLNAQITGWNNLHQSMITLTTELRNELEATRKECDMEITELKRRMMVRDHRIAELENKLRSLNVRVDDIDGKTE